jgi:hypothetical protein
MTGTVGDQTWRLGEAEKFKEGSIWKGNRRKGVRYTIDWGSAAAMNPAGPQNAPTATTTTNPAATNTTQPLITLPPSGNNIPMGSNNNDVSLVAGNQGNAVLDASGNPLTGDGSNMMWNSGNMPSLNNLNPGGTQTQAPPAVTANKNLVTPGQSDVIKTASEVNTIDQTAIAGTSDGSNMMWNSGNMPTLQNPNPKSSAPDKPVVPAEPTARELRQDKRSLKKDMRKASRAMKNLVNDNADQSQMPEVMQRAFQQQADGGNVDPVDLANAVALINRAFGGMIPKAVDGMDLGAQDANKNGIPDYLEAENLPANQPNPFDKSGTIEESNAKKLNIDWNAAGDLYMNAAAKVTNFANRMNAMNPERDMAKFSALNRPSNTYDTMKQGLYDQAGNFIPNDIGNQVLNPTDTYYNNQRQIFAYGGRVYEIGGEVDLDDNELAELAAAGFKLSRV